MAGRPRTASNVRFEEKYTPEPMSGCWIWTAYVDRLGYGKFYVGTKSVNAHRWSYEYHVGPIPAGLVLDHLCRNTSCVNPNHLEAVTQKVNTLRGLSPSAMHAVKTHCIAGHEFNAENTYKSPRGRVCKQCRRKVDKLRSKKPHRIARNHSDL